MVAVSDNHLRQKLRLLIENGWIEIPDERRYGGTGGPGKLLEDELGVDGGNDDLPDAGRWELKYHSGTSLLTLFHKEALPAGHLEHLVRNYGWRNEQNQMCFRHTVSGVTGRGFFIKNENSKISVHNQDYPDEVLAYWSHDRIMNAFVAKLRHLVVVKGERQKNWVRYTSAHFFKEPQSSNLMDAIESGLIYIDFDAREKSLPSKALRNHGTKFRITFENLKLIYHDFEELDPVLGEAIPGQENMQPNFKF